MEGSLIRPFQPTVVRGFLMRKEVRYVRDEFGDQTSQITSLKGHTTRSTGYTKQAMIDVQVSPHDYEEIRPGGHFLLEKLRVVKRLIR
jgi:hypothetical protein